MDSKKNLKNWLLGRSVTRSIALPTELQGTCLKINLNFKFIFNNRAIYYQDQIQKYDMMKFIDLYLWLLLRVSGEGSTYH